MRCPRLVLRAVVRRGIVGGTLRRCVGGSVSGRVGLTGLERGKTSFLWAFLFMLLEDGRVGVVSLDNRCPSSSLRGFDRTLESDIVVIDRLCLL